MSSEFLSFFDLNYFLRADKLAVSAIKSPVWTSTNGILTDTLGVVILCSIIPYRELMLYSSVKFIR